MNRSTLAVMAVVLMLGSGLAGYLIGRPGDSVDKPRPPVTATTTTPPATTTPPVQQASTPPAAPRPQPAANEFFNYRRLSIDSSRTDGEACLAFNNALSPADRVKYEDYLRIAPEVKAAVRIVDDKLCVAGFAYGQDYSVRLLAGLPALDGSKLEEDRTVDVALGARPPVVSVPGKGFILPRGSTAGLPVTTVNVSKVGIAVFRVGERGLQRFAQDRYSDVNFPTGGEQTDWWTLRQWLNGDNGTEIWRGTMEVRNTVNLSVSTAFPIRETIKDWQPGAYFVVVWNAAKPLSSFDEYDENRAETAGLWVIDTDIALTSFSGGDGISVFARSIDSARALAGIEVVLLSRGNEQLARAKTDANGRATFPAGLAKGRGAAEPVAVVAFDSEKKEFSRLELTKAAFDLSDRGIEGRDPPGPVDAFLYTERGVYRPGETVHLVALLRDGGGAALKDLPVTLVVTRPDGTEFKKIVSAIGAGSAVVQSIDLPKSSRRGRWSIAAHVDPKAPSVGRVEFAVEDFVPEKLKIELSSAETVLHTDRSNKFTIAADFLYGAPGSGLNTEADMRVTVDPAPFPAFAAYVFGPEKEREKFEAPFITLKPGPTGDDGKAEFAWAGTDVADTVLPLRALVTARVFEPGDGRSTKTDKSFPLRTRELYLGIKPGFDGKYSREGSDVTFGLVAVDDSGKQIARQKVEYRIEKVTWTYQWYQTDGRWRWQSIQNERVVVADSVDLKADATVMLNRRLSWGQHRLTVSDPEGATSTSMTFYVGWYGGDGGEDAPDTLKVASDKEKYAPGEKARLRIEAPFAGEALIAIGTDGVKEIRSVAVAPGGTTVEIEMKAEWGAGAYALVTAYRPLAAPAERTPVRAIGAVWLGLDPALRSLAVTIGTPEKITPRQKIDVPVRVANAGNAEVYVTLAAVDEGILQLTRYKTPKPAEHYFGKRKLALAMRDDYGRLLDGRADDLGRIRAGGDSGDIGGLDVVPTRTVALFSGAVKLDAKGEAKISFEVPDFIGQLRLMAVAFDPTRVGSAEQRLFVRDAVASDVILPRFLAPGDNGRLAVSLHNIEGQAGDYRLTVEAGGAVSLPRPIAETRRLAANQREVLTYALRGGEPGFGKVMLSLTGPGGFSVKREWDIQVRAAQTPAAVDTVAELAGGREITLDRNLTAGFVAGTTLTSVALSRTPGIDVPGLLRKLDKYPFGCLEQTTSRAMPLLYYNDVALLGYGPQDPKIEDRVQEAVYRVVDMQVADGSFGMWGPYTSPAAEWLQVYALDFMVRARERQMVVPAAAMERGLSWLNRNVERFSPNAQAYGWYVLAKAGLADPGRVRYLQDTHTGNDKPIRGGLAWAHLAAALNLVGEPGRARLALARAQATLEERDPSDYYGSALRDRAAILALAPEAGGREAVTMVMASVRERLVARINETTTQEQAWLLLAARALGGGGDIAYALNGQDNRSTTDPVVINPTEAQIGAGIRLGNKSDRPMWVQVTARGVPKDPQPAASNGFTVERHYYTLDGKPADLARVRQNDRLVVSVRGSALQRRYHELAILDLLPAGFEIESVVDAEARKSYGFLPGLSAVRIAEARDDRFFAALDLGERPFTWFGNSEKSRNFQEFHVAYIVRAVTPGTFALPAVQVEDMYAPRFHARTALGRVTVLPK